MSRYNTRSYVWKQLTKQQKRIALALDKKPKLSYDKGFLTITLGDGIVEANVMPDGSVSVTGASKRTITEELGIF